MAAYVAAFDTWAGIGGHEMLTTAFRRGVAHPLHRTPVMLAWAVTTAHLFRLLPPRVDPFHIVGEVASAAWRRGPTLPFRHVLRSRFDTGWR